jgi:tetratricopeptide (TPR) repeat protein
MGLRKWEEAAQAFKESAARMIWSPDHSYLNLGFCYTQLLRWEDAIEAFKKILKNDDETAWTFLGYAYAGADQYEEAALTYQKGLKTNPKSSALHYNLGVIYLIQGKKDHAPAKYRILKKLDKDAAKMLKDMINEKIKANKSRLWIVVPPSTKGKKRIVIVHPEEEGKKYFPLVE